MATSGLSIKEIIKNVTDNKESYTKVDFTHLGDSCLLSGEQVKDLAEALKNNTNVSEVNLEKRGVQDAGAVEIAEVLKTNTTITKIDLGYNKICQAMKELGEAFEVNKSVVECKLHRQEKDNMGVLLESNFVKMWDKNVTCCKMYITLHDRRCNQTNTKAEVRNKKIAARIKKGENWDDLDPAKAEETAKKLAEKQKAEKEAKEALNAPIKEKVASTGGPYTYKQLTCLMEFRPDDVDPKKRETYLDDEEFKATFEMDKDAFNKLAGWKKLNLKKSKNLH